jgi:hypothetical protein
VTTSPAFFDEPVLLIRITNTFRPNLSSDELYDATRGSWVVGDRRNDVRYAVAVFQGTVLDVFEVHRWEPGGSTLYESGVNRGPHPSHRWEFIGLLAPYEIRRKYKGKLVDHYFVQGNQNPIRYVNC